MALKLLRSELITPIHATAAVQEYIKKTGNYNVTDWLDTHAFNPLFDAAQNAIAIFSGGTQRLELSLTTLFPTYPLADILIEFTEANISHGLPVFSEAEQSRFVIDAYYEAALNELPDEYRSKLLFWKNVMTDTEQTILSGRKNMWNRLWKHRFQICYSYHPALFQTMVAYQGPIGLFLQQVHAEMLVHCGPKAMSDIYDAVICHNWTLSVSKNPRFLKLWNQIVGESACVYLNRKTVKKGTSNSSSNEILDATAINMHNRSPSILRNPDKLLCFLLLLFHVPYRQKLAQILLEEPWPGFLANVKALYPKLMSHFC